MKRLSCWTSCVILAAAPFYLGTATAFGNITINGPAAGNHINTLPATDADDTITLNPDPVTYVPTATAAMKGALAAQFPAWTFVYMGGLNGTLNINSYEATTTGDDNGGGLIDATYTRAATDPAIADLHWIQLVTTNYPLGGGPVTGYIDPLPNDDTLPFYWTLPEDGNALDGNKTATTYHFYDNSSRNDRTDPDLINWSGQLMLASWDGNDPGTVYVYDGINWGWTLVDTVPEPSSVAALLLVGGLALKRQRRTALN